MVLTYQGVPADLGTPKQRALLALLLVRLDAVVPLDEIVDELWGYQPPASAQANARMYAANLRRLFARGPDAPTLQKRPPGYRLTLDPAEFDLPCFRSYAQRGREAAGAGDFAAAAGWFQQAAGLWRGRALADVPLGTALLAWRGAVERERLAALEGYAQALLQLGEHDQAAGVAHEVLRVEPARESAHALLMRARYAAGDLAGALGAFDAARQVLVEELGVDPGVELATLHRAVLNRDPALGGAGTAGVVGASRVPVVPRQLPADVFGFAGREAALAALNATLETAAQPTAVVISALSGTAGVGKSALAVHWGHLVADRFPDGQLYVNLRGFDPSGAALDPAVVLRDFLDALDVPAGRVPASLDGQVGLYRSLLADRRVLVLLDNARDADQVRVLLPGTPGCLVVVTSRNLLPGLVAAEGARPLVLDLLSAEEARQMLAGRLGPGRVAAEQAAVDEIVSACARLPLALAIVAARAATHPQFTLASLAAELRDGLGGLEAFRTNDPATDVRSVFSWSYRTLSPAAARLFRLLGLHPGPDLAVGAAASLAGLSVEQTGPMLSELAQAHLVTEQAPGRYGCHDLLRAYAGELAGSHDSAGDRHAALHRLLDGYLYTADAADRLLDPQRDRVPLAPAVAGAVRVALGTADEALAWLAAEHRVLVAATALAASTGFDRHAWQLAWALTTYVNRRGHWRDWSSTQRLALATAERTGDRVGRAHAHRGIGRAAVRLGRYDDARAELEHALGLFGGLGDHTSEARTHQDLAQVLDLQGRRRDALRHVEQSLELFRLGGHRVGEANALADIGWCHALLGDYEQALGYCREALAIHRETGNRQAEPAAWDSLGYAYHHLGDHAQAIECYRQSLDLYRETGERYYEAGTLTHLGETHHAAGDAILARRFWQQALDILVELGHPDADELRARLAPAGPAEPGAPPAESAAGGAPGVSEQQELQQVERLDAAAVRGGVQA
jgi:DNA-binding SARP family transcriptional activator